jgi:Xaa-Pro aminopeptidase
MPGSSREQESAEPRPARLVAGIPSQNMTLYNAVRFAVGDPAALIELPTDNGGRRRVFILRDIELDRARQHAAADECACPADYAPAEGLSGDRETATAQAAAECLRRAGVNRVVADRSLPLIFAHHAEQAGISVAYDADLGVRERRQKDDAAVDALRAAQRVTEQAMAMACRLIARAEAGADGVLQHEGEPLTAERVRAAIDVFLLERNFENGPCIVAPGVQGADCHERGAGPIRTGEPVIIDIFPRDRRTLFNGDCTRVVVHGEPPKAFVAMHEAVVEAKAAAIAAVRAGATGEAVHEAAIGVIARRGFGVGLPTGDTPPEHAAMVHGTGHGIGLEVHEPPLLDRGGPELLEGDALTVEPGLYCPAIGGVRIEDMVIVRDEGCENLNTLPEHWAWDA